MNWGMGELLAFGSLLMEGTDVRMSGQDVQRGTFVQRHAVLHDHITDEEWSPLEHLSEDQGKFRIYNSFLSEYGVLGFEYGYSVERPDSLVVWEAQFGDFANGAQTIIDEFVSSSEQKWGSVPRWLCCFLTATRVRVLTTPRLVLSVTCSCALRTT